MVIQRVAPVHLGNTRDQGIGAIGEREVLHGRSVGRIAHHEHVVGMGAEGGALIAHAVLQEAHRGQGRVEGEHTAVVGHAQGVDARLDVELAQGGIVAEAPRGLVVGRIGEQPVHVAGGERVGQAVVATQEGLADERHDMGRLLVDVPVVGGALLRVGAAEPEGDLVERDALGGDGAEDGRA